MATKNFTNAELKCPCCGGLPPRAFQYELQILRDNYGKPMVLNSAYRCPTYDAQVHRNRFPDYAAHERHGPHTIGAVDVSTALGDAFHLIHCALDLGWTGVGVKQKGVLPGRFVHLDMCEDEPGRPRPTIWTY